MTDVRPNFRQRLCAADDLHLFSFSKAEAERISIALLRAFEVASALGNLRRGEVGVGHAAIDPFLLE